MGVRGIWEHMHQHMETIDANHLRFHRLAIDGTLWLHESIKGCSLQYLNGKKPYLSTFLHRCRALLELKIEQLVVFDSFNYPKEKIRHQGKTCSTFGFSQALSPPRPKPSKLKTETQHRPRTIHLVLTEIKKLLTALGISFVDSPTEGEAQCAWLEETHVVDGAISDDFDYFLFGGVNLYRVNFSKATPEFRRISVNSLVREQGLNRNRLIALALMIGCDYYSGVPKIGFVTAMEVLAEFADSDEDDHPHTILERFRLKLLSIDHYTLLLSIFSRSYCGLEIAQIQKTDSREKVGLRNAEFKFPAGFPDGQIIELYTNPMVDTRFRFDSLKRGKIDEREVERVMVGECAWTKEKCLSESRRSQRRSERLKQNSCLLAIGNNSLQEQPRITAHFPVVRKSSSSSSHPKPNFSSKEPPCASTSRQDPSKMQPSCRRPTVIATVSKGDNWTYSRREWAAMNKLKRKASHYYPSLESTNDDEQPQMVELTSIRRIIVPDVVGEETADVVDLE